MKNHTFLYMMLDKNYQTLGLVFVKNNATCFPMIVVTIPGDKEWHDGYLDLVQTVQFNQCHHGLIERISSLNKVGPNM